MSQPVDKQPEFLLHKLSQVSGSYYPHFRLMGKKERIWGMGWVLLLDHIFTFSAGERHAASSTQMAHLL